jgi:hypothetical protein
MAYGHFLNKIPVLRRKIFNSENMCVFSFNYSICHALLLNYCVWIRIRQKISDSFGFGSATLAAKPNLTTFLVPAKPNLANFLPPAKQNVTTNLSHVKPNRITCLPPAHCVPPSSQTKPNIESSSCQTKSYHVTSSCLTQSCSLER